MNVENDSNLSKEKMAVTPDMTVIDINKAIQRVLSAYLDPNVEIRFDLPDPENLPSEPVVSVFLYDIHEDLPLRTGNIRQYDHSSGYFVPGRINICCNYIITYWDSGKNSSHAKGADNQSLLVMNQVLNALLNNRGLVSTPGVMTKIIPPKDELNGLGNFWQALGNKPRLLLNYSVTTSMALNGQQEYAMAIKSNPDLNMQSGV